MRRIISSMLFLKNFDWFYISDTEIILISEALAYLVKFDRNYFINVGQIYLFDACIREARSLKRENIKLR